MSGRNETGERRTWDIGDADPGDMTAVWDYTDPTGDGEGWSSMSAHWGRTVAGDEWKGYKDGKEYLSWAELLRRWGPVTESKPVSS